MTDTTEVSVSGLEPGDRILWGDRKEPLEVQNANIHVSGVEGAVAREVKSQRGTTYCLIDNGYGDPKVKKQMTPTPNHPSGEKSCGYADDLRRVEDD